MKFNIFLTINFKTNLNVNEKKFSLTFSRYLSIIYY